MNAEKMKFRNIRQFKLSAVGYGAMELSHGYGACPDHKESIRLLKKSFELGCNFIDTAKHMVGEKTNVSSVRHLKE